MNNPVIFLQKYEIIIITTIYFTFFSFLMSSYAGNLTSFKFPDSRAKDAKDAKDTRFQWKESRAKNAENAKDFPMSIWRMPTLILQNFAKLCGFARERTNKHRAENAKDQRWKYRLHSRLRGYFANFAPICVARGAIILILHYTLRTFAALREKKGLSHSFSKT
jgi:hypothetical protein